MKFLEIPPDQTSYAAQDGANLGMSVDQTVFRNVLNQTATVDVQWIASQEEYTYLATVHRAFRKSGNAPFLISLFFDDAKDLVTYVAVFVADTFRLASVEGETFTVTARLEIVPAKYDVDKNDFVVDIGLSQRVIRAKGAVFNLTGKPVVFHFLSSRFPARAGQFIITGGDVTSGHSRIVSAQRGLFALSGKNVAFNKNGGFSAGFGSFTLTGQNATLTASTPGDDLPFDADGAWSVRKLNPSYSGYCMQVRRSSDDTTADIGFVADSPRWTLDVDALLAFVGSESGYVVKLYDQIGSSDLVQTSNLPSQPRIVNAGVLETMGGAPALRFRVADATNLNTSGAALNWGAGEWTIQAFLRFLTDSSSSSSTTGTLFDKRIMGGTNEPVLYFYLDGKVYFNNSAVNAEVEAYSTGVDYHMEFSKSGTTVKGFRDGVLYGSTASDTVTASNNSLYVGNNYNATGGFDGWMNEVIVTKGLQLHASSFTPIDPP